jgi:putative inorganic carbon (hco3(-)) transporter
MTADVAAIRSTRLLVPCAAVGFLIIVLLQQNILLALGALAVIGFLALMLRWPEIGTLVVLFSIYSNVAVLAMRSQAAIQATAGSADHNPRITIVLAALSLLLCVPLVHQFIVRKKELIFDQSFFLMVAFFAVLLASSFFARNNRIVGSEIADYLLEGLALYFLLTNVVRDFPTLRRASWTLLLAGSLVAGLTIFQKVTHTENKTYGGLAQISPPVESALAARKVLGRLRAEGPGGQKGTAADQVRPAGPIGEPNRYAQTLLVLLPLAFLLLRRGRSRTSQALALAATGLILGGLLLTFSRAALLAGIVVFGMAVYMRLLRPRHVLFSLLGVGLFVAVIDPGVVARMATLERLKSLFSRTHATSQAADSSAVLRYVIAAAAWHVFIDHPILGVGPGHFAEYYSIPYGNRVGLIDQRKKYLGHNLYLEKLAETGLIGLACFLSIPFVIMRGLWKERKRLAQSHPELADTATAFFLSLTAYAISAVFDHLSYQRYFWLLMALSSAAIRIAHSRSEEQVIDESTSLQSEPL